MQSSALYQQWSIFFTVDATAAAALAGLLFICFSIYITKFNDFDPLEIHFTTYYYYEFLYSLAISLAALLPFDVWWLLAFMAGLIQIIFMTYGLFVARPYRYSYKILFKKKPGKKNMDVDVFKAEIYKTYKTWMYLSFVPFITGTLLMLAGIFRFLHELNVSIALFNLPKIIFIEWPLPIAGIVAGLFLLSAATGTWSFLPKIQQRPREKPQVTNQEQTVQQKAVPPIAATIDQVQKEPFSLSRLTHVVIPLTLFFLVYIFLHKKKSNRF